MFATANETWNILFIVAVLISALVVLWLLVRFWNSSLSTQSVPLSMFFSVVVIGVYVLLVAVAWQNLQQSATSMTSFQIPLEINEQKPAK